MSRCTLLYKVGGDRYGLPHLGMMWSEVQDNGVRTSGILARFMPSARLDALDVCLRFGRRWVVRFTEVRVIITG